MGERLTPRAGARGRAGVRLVPALAALAVIVATASLGNWQMRRAAEKQALQTQREAALSDAPIRLGSASLDASALDGRRVVGEGTFDDSRTVFLDNRTRGGVAGFHVVTPLRLDPSATHVLVLRGWIARDMADRTRLPPLRTPAGPVRVEGLAMATLPQPMLLGADAAPAQGERIWQHLTLQRYREWSSLAVLPVIVRQTSGLDDGLVREWAQPGSDVDKHRGYAFQWFAMTAVTAGLWLVFGYLRPGGKRPSD